MNRALVYRIRKPSAPVHNNDVSTPERYAAMMSVTLGETLNCEAVGIRLLDDNGHLPYVYQQGFPPQYRAASEEAMNINHPGSICAQVLMGEFNRRSACFSDQGSFVINSSADVISCEDEDTAELHLLQGEKPHFESVALTALRSQGQVLGLIHCADSRPQRFTPEWIGALEVAAPTIARGLFYDLLWRPADWIGTPRIGRAQPVCPVCHRVRLAPGQWVTDRRKKPRSPWPAVEAPHVVCPSCLLICNCE